MRAHAQAAQHPRPVLTRQVLRWGLGWLSEIRSDRSQPHSRNCRVVRPKRTQGSHTALIDPRAQDAETAARMVLNDETLQVALALASAVALGLG